MHDLSDPAVRKLTAEILARPEFSAVAPKLPFWVDWLHRLSQWLQKLQLLHDSAPLLYWTIFATVIVVTLGLLAHIVWTLRIAMSAPDAPPPELAPGRAAPDLAREASTLADAGYYLEAGHRLMLASFHALAAHSIIDLRPDRSNQWIRGALRNSPLPTHLADDLDLLVDRTERRWFGGRENDPAIYTQWRSLFERLCAQVR